MGIRILALLILLSCFVDEIIARSVGASIHND
ncbi:hypothetical protein Slit_2144 [Sideroxydans lithotrophicus ES-1]|uniref:Uncharacterized protein n=1 Tax=Sideroxydans lithotrophicus (strain ES-1) TaxID=580332 RepID=D5CUI5_SIDLE|nr:hypothetical protein Slit_2144 [Sideroxydans lithotrophicus ES-1]